MIIVTGATGQLGRAIVEQLLVRMPADQVGVSVRDPGKASDLAALGVRVRQGDFGDPGSLMSAFEGARQILVVSSNVGASGGDPIAHHRNAIQSAQAAGGRRIVYTSHMSASAASAFPPSRDHAATEDVLRASGLAWTALRHGFYAESGLMLMGSALETGTVEAPADGKVSWATHADLAEAAAIILVSEGMFDGPTPPLTGPEALDFADIAALASQVLGRPFNRSLLSDDDLQQRLAKRNVPEAARRIAAGYYLAARAGEFAAVDPTLERLLGRRPTDMQAVIADKINR